MYLKLLYPTCCVEYEEHVLSGVREFCEMVSLLLDEGIHPADEMAFVVHTLAFDLYVECDKGSKMVFDPMEYKASK